MGVDTLLAVDRDALGVWPKKSLIKHLAVMLVSFD